MIAPHPPRRKAIANPSKTNPIALLTNQKAITSLPPQEKRSPTPAQAEAIALIATNHGAIASIYRAALALTH